MVSLVQDLSIEEEVELLATQWRGLITVVAEACNRLVQVGGLQASEVPLDDAWLTGRAVAIAHRLARLAEQQFAAAPGLLVIDEQTTLSLADLTPYRDHKWVPTEWSPTAVWKDFSTTYAQGGAEESFCQSCATFASAVSLHGLNMPDMDGEGGLSFLFSAPSLFYGSGADANGRYDVCSSRVEHLLGIGRGLAAYGVWVQRADWGLALMESLQAWIADSRRRYGDLRYRSRQKIVVGPGVTFHCLKGTWRLSLDPSLTPTFMAFVKTYAPCFRAAA